jgi:hypothetical protein
MTFFQDLEQVSDACLQLLGTDHDGWVVEEVLLSPESVAAKYR